VVAPAPAKPCRKGELPGCDGNPSAQERSITWRQFQSNYRSSDDMRAPDRNTFNVFLNASFDFPPLCSNISHAIWAGNETSSMKSLTFVIFNVIYRFEGFESPFKHWNGFERPLHWCKYTLQSTPVTDITLNTAWEQRKFCRCVLIHNAEFGSLKKYKGLGIWSNLSNAIWIPEKY